MSFRIPPQGHKARELIDLPSIAVMLAPENAMKLHTTQGARNAAFKAFEADSAIRRVCYVVIRADTDDRWLISFGRKGGWRKEWNFGNGRS